MAKLQLFEPEFKAFRSETHDPNRETQEVDSLSEHEQGAFVRLEDKYLLSAQQVSKLTPLVNSKMRNAAPNPNTDFTLIRSLYFDDKNLFCLRSYLGSEPKRFKLRTRQYAPNGKWDEAIFLEYKAKVDGVCKKSRIEIDTKSLSRLVTGKEINLSEKLLSLNPMVQERTILKRLKRVNDAVKGLKLEPIIQVQYSRLAFQDESIRLTLDKDIQATPVQSMSTIAKLNITRNAEWSQILKTTQNLSMEKPHVLEVKHMGEIPSWLTQFLSEENILSVKFSKYCLGTSFPILDSVHEGKKGKS